MTKWQPIKTAPRDGTEFLAVWNDCDPIPYGVVSYRECGWQEGFSGVREPTHWMPLLEPPNAQ